MSIPGRVYLVGAGPGDPGLLTLRGKQCLCRADVVFYDYLVNPQVLAHAPATAQCICLGRHGGGRIMPQDEVNRQMLQHAVAGKTVVRLKGGDPMVFARAAEEITALLNAEIRFEIVPGVTAALAAASYMGMPMTDRDKASAVALVTGQERAGKLRSDLDFPALSRFPGTIVFYMGVTTAPEWSLALIKAGKPPETPVAIIRRCTLPDQEVIRCTLQDVAGQLAPGRMRPPVLVVIGEVAHFAPAASWFEQLPLFGQRVLVTRPRHQADAMVGQFAELGAAVLVQPAIEIGPPDDWGRVDAAIGQLDRYDYLVFSSANGVRYFLDRIDQQGRDLRCLGGLNLASVGPATAEALGEYHLRNDIVPDEYRAEGLAEALAADAKGRRFLLLRASRGREVLAESLRAAGAQVDQVVVYSSRDVNEPADEIAAAMAAGEITWTTVTSSAIARSLVDLFGEDLHHTGLVSISPVTSQTLRECGFEPAAEATVYTADGVIDAVLQAATGQ